MTVVAMFPDTVPQAEDGVRALLAALPEDPEREGLRDTPGRVVRALREMTEGYSVDVGALLHRDFDAGHRTDQMVAVTGVEFVSLCEHHLLPFTGTATVAYLPAGNRVVGLSKLARLVDAYARRLQVQERMTAQITAALTEHLTTENAACVIRARHTCMGLRGARKAGADMVTSSLLGVFRDEPAARAEFFALAR